MWLFGLTGLITFCLFLFEFLLIAFDLTLCLLLNGSFPFGSYFLDLYGIVLGWLMFHWALWHFLLSCASFSGMLLDSILLLQSILPFTGCPVYERILPFDSYPFLWFFVACDRFFDLHIIYIHHIRDLWAIQKFAVFVWRSSLCLYYITLICFFNPECCIKQTISFGAKCRKL